MVKALQQKTKPRGGPASSPRGGGGSGGGGGSVSLAVAAVMAVAAFVCGLSIGQFVATLRMPIPAATLAPKQPAVPKQPHRTVRNPDEL